MLDRLEHEHGRIVRYGLSTGALAGGVPGLDDRHVRVEVRRVGGLDVDPLADGHEVRRSDLRLQRVTGVGDQALVDVRPDRRILDPRIHARERTPHGPQSTGGRAHARIRSLPGGRQLRERVKNPHEGKRPLAPQARKLVAWERPPLPRRGRLVVSGAFLPHEGECRRRRLVPDGDATTEAESRAGAAGRSLARALARPLPVRAPRTRVAPPETAPRSAGGPRCEDSS